MKIKKITKRAQELTADIEVENTHSYQLENGVVSHNSVLLETASGIHGEHSKRFIRNIQLSKDTEVAQIIKETNPSMVDESVWSASGTDYCVSFPVICKDGSIYKADLLGVKQLDYVKIAQEHWVNNGTTEELCAIPGITHNVSNTITVDDWDEVTDYIYENRKSFCGISLLSAQGDKAYPQAPFTEVFTHEEIVEKYGIESLMTSALIESGLDAFNHNLWNAITTATGNGETLSKDNHEDLKKRDFVRRFKKFAKNFASIDDCANCLKDVHNLHTWWKINKKFKKIDWNSSLKEKKFTDIDTNGAQACSGGACEISF